VENQDNDFLLVRLDHTGAAHLKKLLTTTRWLFIIGMLLTLLFIVGNILRNHFINPDRFSSNLPLYLEMRLHNWYVAVYCLFFSWQLVLYLRFVQQANKGAVLLDNTRFNHSFRILYRSNVIALVHFSFSVVMAVLEVWANYDLSKMAKALHK